MILNRLKFLKGMLFIFLSFCTLSISAQSDIITLEQCRQSAIDNNNLLKAASEQERAAYYQKREALMQFFPKLDASGTYLHFSEDLHLISSSFLPEAIQILPSLGGGLTIPVPEGIRQGVHDIGTIDMSNFWIAGFSITQPIFAGGKIIAYNDLRAYAEELAILQRDTKLADIIVEVDEAYWQVVSLAGKKKLAQSYVELMKKLSSDIEQLEKEGMATKSDKLSVSVKLNEAELSLTKTDNGLRLSKMLLCQICGIDITDNIKLFDEDREIEDMVYVHKTDYDIEKALSQRAEIASLETLVKINSQQEKIARADFLPTIGISTGYKWTNPNLHDGLKKEFAGSWNIGISIKIPINPVSSSSKYKATQAQTRKNQYELEDAKEKIKLQINQSNYKFIEANRRIAVSAYNVEKAEENLKYANVGFEEGVISSSDVMAAYAGWVAAESDRIDAQIDLRMCKVYFDRALGNNLIDINNQNNN